MQKAHLIRSALAGGFVTLFALSAAVSADVKLNGSGASFPFPIYSKWFKDFSKAEEGIRSTTSPRGAAPAFRI